MAKLTKYFFQRIHGNNLVYNTCWEDPRCDRALLDLNKNSNILMITSAGCNALEYLLDEVNSIHCVDLNFRQNAVLALKIALIKNGDFELLFQFFGKGGTPKAKFYYQEYLRHHIPEEYQSYWDKKIKYFNKKGIRNSFYYRGSSGLIAYVVTRYLKAKPKLKSKINDFFECLKLENQIRLYEEIRTGLFSPLTKRIFHSQWVLNWVGVPSSQTHLFKDDYQESKGGYIGASFDRVFKKLPVRDNYFYSVYFNGEYERDRCPEYLKEENFEFLKENIDKIQLSTSSLEDYCDYTDQKFSHFILLDHMDWLAANNHKALLSEWKSFFQCAEKDATVLFRSAAQNIDWLPEEIKERILFEEAINEKCIDMDRVGTYASTWLGKIKN